MDEPRAKYPPRELGDNFNKFLDENLSFGDVVRLTKIRTPAGEVRYLAQIENSTLQCATEDGDSSIMLVLELAEEWAREQRDREVERAKPWMRLVKS